MTINDFNKTLDAYVKDNKGLSQASKQSEKDISDQGLRSVGRFKEGKMYSFRYFTPDEPKYDTSPLIISLGSPRTGYQLGLNLHYLPYNVRVDFVSTIIKSYTSFFTRQISGNIIKNPRLQPGLSGFNYNSLNEALGARYNFKHAIHLYKLQRIHSPLILGFENWHLGVVNNENYFFGTNINEAQALYYKNI
jgi:hypothetical protein